MERDRPIRVLFVCTGNSCRSQMAEAWTRRLKGDVIHAYSAGLTAHGLNRVAVQVMLEKGVDLSWYRSKRIEELRAIRFDYVVTVCDAANARCPVFPGGPPVLHVAFDDPPALARTAASDDEAINHYRRVRDEIRAFVETLPERLREARPQGEEKTEAIGS